MVVVGVVAIIVAVASFSFCVGYVVSHGRDEEKIRSLEILYEVEREKSGSFGAANANLRRLVDSYKAVCQEMKDALGKLDEQR